MRKFYPILLSPYFIAFFIILLILLLFPFRFSRYSLIIDDYGYVEKEEGRMFCSDLDNDGSSELLIEFRNIMGNVAFKLFKGDWTLIDQWNFNGGMSKMGTAIRDFKLGQDSLSHIAAFYLRRDSVFLSIVQPWPRNEYLVTERFVTTVKRWNDTIDYNLSPVYVADITGDGYDDMIFDLVAGFSRIPRSVFIYDIQNDSIHRSESFGFAPVQLELYDLDDDGLTEVLLGTTTRGNIPDTMGIPYSDYRSYVVALDDDLELMFEPLSYDVFPSSSRVWVSKDENGEISITGVFIPRTAGHSSIIMYVMNSKGEVITFDSIRSEQFSLGASIEKFKYRSDDYFVIYTRNGVGIIIDKEMNVVETSGEIAYKPVTWQTMDLDRDGQVEHIAISGFGYDRVTVTDFWLNITASVDLPGEGDFPVSNSFHLKRNIASMPQLFLQRGNMWYLLSYQHKPLFFLNYLVYLGIYFGVLLFILAILRIQKNQLEKKYETERKLVELQLMTIKGQIDPHFTFNAMNSIGAVIFKEDRKTAYGYFTKFSKLIRLALESSDKLSRTLEEELDFVTLYLELERFRFKEKFNYEIRLDENVNTSMHVPRMIIQTFVENSIKHGLMNIEGEGKLNIEVQQKDSLIIRIRDNGIGLERAAYMKGRTTGRGIRIIDRIIELYEKVNGKRISYRLIEIKKEGNVSEGTEALITIPM